MFKKLGLEWNHFLLALIPWAVAMISAPFVLFFAGNVLWITALVVLLGCWLEKGITYASKVLLASIILMIGYYVWGMVVSQISLLGNEYKSFRFSDLFDF